MDDVFILNENGNNAAHSGLLRLHDAVGRRESERPEAALSPEELLARFRAADPTRNAAFLPWLLRTYAAGGYRLEDLSKAHDTLVTFARLRGLLPNTATIDGEARNPRRLGSHITLASLWTAIAPLVEEERLAQEEKAGEQPDTDRERALSQSRVLHRSARVVIAVPMTVEASCWWGQGTQWCTAARKNNVFEEYHKYAPLIVICLRKFGDLPARKLQMHVHAYDKQFMDENDARVSPELILERWQELKAVIHWAVGRNGEALTYVPEHLRTEELCLAAVGRYGRALRYVPEPLRTEVVCLAALKQTGLALEYVPERLRTKAICTVAVEQDGRALEYVPKPIRMEAVCLAAVEQDGRALEFVPEPLRTEVMFLAAVEQNGLALRFVPEHLRTEAICTTAVYRDGRALRFVPEHLRTEAICLTTVKQNGLALEFVPEPLRTEAMCRAAITQDVMALNYIPTPLRTESVCLAAVSRDGGALACVPKPLRTEAICWAAVIRNGWALRYVPEPLRTEALCLAAVTEHGGALQSVPEPLRTEAICTTAVGRNREALEHVPEPLLTKAICTATIGGDKQESVFATSETNIRKSRDLILAGLEDCLKNLQPSHFILSP